MSVEADADHLQQFGRRHGNQRVYAGPALWARDEKRKEEPMSGLFGDAEASAAEKLKRAGTAGRTILAALPKDPDGETDRVLTPDQVVDKRFPPPHRQMPTYERGADGEILYESPAQIIDKRFPSPDEVDAVTADLKNDPTIRKAINRKRDEYLRERRKR
jgi:hypothetical protein